MPDTLANRVVVITGASSGLGKAAALEFAEHRCRLVLAARRLPELEATAALCRAAGAEAIVVQTDVTIADQVGALVRAALQQWQRIDVWVNNAGVTMIGYLHQGEFADHERVIETNLLGPIHAARSVVPVFLEQKTGTMINVGSILSKVGQPFVPAYTISKFGLRGLSEALRVQLADYPDIHVCTLMPYAMDTPHFESAANVFGRAARAMHPVQSPRDVARELVGLAQHPRRELHAPRYAPLGFVMRWLAPRTTERLLLHSLKRFHLAESEANTEGSLYVPREHPGAVRGTRQAITNRPAFALWVLRELASIVAGDFSRWRHTHSTRS